MRLPVLPPRGNALIEYRIIGALVMVASIIALMAFGEQLAVWVDGLKTDMSKSVVASASRSSASTGIGGNKFNPGLGSNGNAGSGSGTLDSAANALNSTDTADVSVTVTSGTNGGTDVTYTFSSQLQSIVDQLEKKEADPTVINLIQQLANSGHNLAEKQKALENFCPPNRVCVVTDDYYTTGYDQIAQIDQYLNDIKSGRDSFAQQLKQLQDYLAANPKLPADVRAYIEKQAADIIAVADGYKKNQRNMLNRNGMSSGRMRSVDTIDVITEPSITTTVTVSNATGTSTSTTNDSNNICATQPNLPQCTRPAGQAVGSNAAGGNGQGNGSPPPTGGS